MVKTAIIGASGFIGSRLLQSYRQKYPDTVGTCFSHQVEGLTPFDLREPDVAALRLEQTGHRAVILAAARANVSYCERAPEAAHAINVRGTLEVARQLSSTSLQVIFLSSDYVFDGLSGHYDETSPTDPKTEYGRQKQAVEKELPRLLDNHLVLRLAKSYGLEKGEGTLLDEIASHLALGQNLYAATDQFFCPTLIDDLVRAIHAIQKQRLTGTLNVCSPEACSRYSLAITLAKELKADPRLVEPVALHDLPGMDGRPLNTTMNCHRLQTETDVTFASLRTSIQRVADNWRTL